MNEPGPIAENEFNKKMGTELGGVFFSLYNGGLKFQVQHFDYRAALQKLQSVWQIQGSSSACC